MSKWYAITRDNRKLKIKNLHFNTEHLEFSFETKTENLSIITNPASDVVKLELVSFFGKVKSEVYVSPDEIPTIGYSDGKLHVTGQIIPF